MTKLIQSFLLMFWLISAVVSASETQPADSESVDRILVIGDSLSAAYNMPTSEAWPNRLQERLNEHGYIWQVFNSSITGDTTESGLARLPRLLNRYNPRIVIIELGGNDGLRGLPVEVTRRNLATMVELSMEQGAKVLLAGIRIPPNYGTRYVSDFESMYPDLAEEYGTGLVPFFMEGIALDPALMQSDGIHPSVEAQPILLDNLWPAFTELLGIQETSAANE